MAKKKFVLSEIMAFTIPEYACVKGRIIRDDGTEKHVAEIEITLSGKEIAQLEEFVAAVYRRAWRGVEAQP